ncbi:hypothetical protein ACFYRC_19140 [Streptomyces sp. NPDC005279]|uniref:hypothetical protein n=1 Tax=Streptomyces sp. NPDC005279 TaxID=3364712 RepID=UPI0036CA62B5
MTQSGQGDEQQLPAARPAHEGVVLPADGSEPWIPGVSDPQVAPAGGQPWGEPWGPQQQPGQPGQGGQPAQGGYGDVPQGGYDAQGGYGSQAGYGEAPQNGYGEAPQSGYGEAPQSGYGAQAGYGPQAGYGAQALPPQGPPAGALPPQALPPQALPPQAPVMGASDATQYIPPVTAAGPGALPPETPAESTQFLGTVPGAMPGPVSGPDAEATQFIAPVPAGSVPPAPNAAPFGIRPGAPGERQPPAEFDSLFRTDGPGAQPADATAQMPRFEGPLGGQRTRRQPSHQQQHQQPQYQQPQYQQPQGHEPEPGRRKSSHVPLIAAVVVGCAVLGLGVSALMFGGGDDDKKDPGAGKNVAATSDAPKNSSEAAADPAKQQAKALDKLLADSNNSRATVIRSVENIKRCQNLDQASTDLHGAAVQRRGLVTRLEGLTVDKLPDNAALAASLTKAWEASAAADDHYAAWAKQVEGKKGCKDGKARNTGQAGQAARASGDATKAKREASGLWNAIARKYELTERRSDQL